MSISQPSKWYEIGQIFIFTSSKKNIFGNTALLVTFYCSLNSNDWNTPQQFFRTSKFLYRSFPAVLFFANQTRGRVGSIVTMVIDNPPPPMNGIEYQVNSCYKEKMKHVRIDRWKKVRFTFYIYITWNESLTNVAYACNEIEA